MSQDNVKFVNLEPLKVIAFHAMGESPEELVFGQLNDWLKSKGLENRTDLVTTYGYNKPDPTPGKKEYGYEVLLVVNNELDTEGKEIRTLNGGRYASVTTSGGVDSIGPGWEILNNWRKSSEFEYDCERQWLEKNVTPPGTPPERFQLELLMPIKVKD